MPTVDKVIFAPWAVRPSRLANSFALSRIRPDTVVLKDI